MESSNPTLNSKVFDNARAMVGGGQTMTIQGAVNKTLVLFLILCATAFWTWSKAFDPAAAGITGIAGIGGAIVGFILAMVTSFKPQWSSVTAPLYAACEGLLLGVLSAYFERSYPGIVMQAVGLTFGVTLAMLLGYKAGFLHATPGLRKGLMIAMGGIMIFYLVVMVAGFFHVAPPGFINGSGPLGIAFSLFVVGIASMSLVLDFDLVEQGAQQGLEKYMEWYCGFALMVTLVWLYMEILRLLSKLRSRD